MGYYMENGVAYGAGITPITIEGTLVANATSIAFTNDAILEGERYNVYAWDKPTVKPTNMVVSGHTLTLTYPAQSTDTRIKVVINENVNTLMFDDTNKADKSDLTSIFATGSTNTTGSAISAGTYFYLNGLLVRAKTNIATNATFTLNTNYEIETDGVANRYTGVQFNKRYSIYADGVKTNKVLSVELLTGFKNMVNATPSNHQFSIVNIANPTIRATSVPSSYNGSNMSSNIFKTQLVEVSSGLLIISSSRINILNDSTTISRTQFANNSLPIMTDNTNDVPANNTEFFITYNEYVL